MREPARPRRSSIQANRGLAEPSPSPLLIGRSTRPRIDDVYSCLREILDVPSREGRTPSPADGCDQGVETFDWQAQACPPDHYGPEPVRCGAIKWLNQATERSEKIRRC